MTAMSPAIYMAKAQRVFDSARLLLDAGDTEGACNRAYYAMFDAAHAALWASGRLEADTVIKTHSGLASAFGQELVKTGMIDVAHGRALGRVQKFRAVADYTADPPDAVDAREAVTLAEAFINAIQRLIENQSHNRS